MSRKKTEVLQSNEALHQKFPPVTFEVSLHLNQPILTAKATGKNQR